METTDRESDIYQHLGAGDDVIMFAVLSVAGTLDTRLRLFSARRGRVFLSQIFIND
jgi:hypothetical protein